ncbi:hypothetical protein GDO86_009011 [Hymenochirus boettgeri]|uniref:Thrombomodulin n=1 Tax=Hymenochirus boettgeri TaxID=247094 RepID=A0A8T2JJH8_9PIPI|nr:hypothetical protein GDO86_009011 [Hymenochirus boettgeri]
MKPSEIPYSKANFTLLGFVASNLPDFMCLGQSCYFSFGNSKRYQKANRHCNEMGGHLITPNNSVEAEIIRTLFSKAKDKVNQLWIGLEQSQKNGCTNSSLPLRGFQWVTGDSDTHYSNWKSNERKCGDLCVIVHKDLTWEATDCQSKADGYLCEIAYPQTCHPIHLVQGYNVTYSTPLWVGGQDMTFLPPDTEAFFPDLNLLLKCVDVGDGTMKWLSMQHGAWSCTIENGGCDYVCSGDTGVSKCECSADSVLSSDGRSCELVPSGLLCIPDPSIGACICDEGYTLAEDGRTCQDINDCDKPDICEHHCVNTDGSFKCTCKKGFEMVDGKCVDIDECMSPKIPCEHECYNTEGGFVCECWDGYIVDENNPFKCKRFCNTMTCTADCNPNTLECNCPDGYIVDEADANGALCVDIDECDSEFCKYQCDNLPGSYLCLCPEGFVLEKDGSCVSAEDPDEPMKPSEIPTSKPIHPGEVPTVPQSMMILGICVGILSILIFLIAIVCHLVRKHHIDQASLDCGCKSQEKNVVLHQIRTTSPMDSIRPENCY